MANINNPHGLRPIMRNLHGGVPSYRLMTKAASYATRICRGDVVNKASDGTIEVSGTPGTTAFVGVSIEYGAASKLTQHHVCDDPKAVYEVQASNGALAAADVDLNANLALGAGSDSTGQSGHTLDAGTKATTNSLDLKILGLHALPTEVNDWGAYAIVEVIFNRHLRNFGMAGV